MRINKPKEMMRSILPSKARKWAKHKKRDANRSNRRAVNVLLSEYDLDDDDGEFTNQVDIADFTRSREIRFAVRERRGADKINHFVRWAENKTAHLTDIKDKYYFFVSYIGGSGDVIRNHAVGHFIDPRYDFRYGELRSQRYRYYEPMPEISDVTLMEKLSLAIDYGYEGELNQALRSANIRTKECGKSAPCYSEETKGYTISHWEIQPDGTRRRLFGLIPYDGGFRPPVKGVISYNTSYKSKTHNQKSCSNMLQFSGSESVRRVLRFLRSRKKTSTILSLWTLVSDL